jgi:hypothetical protein
LGSRAPIAMLILLPFVLQLTQTAMQPFDPKSVGESHPPADVVVVAALPRAVLGAATAAVPVAVADLHTHAAGVGASVGAVVLVDLVGAAAGGDWPAPVATGR